MPKFNCPLLIVDVQAAFFIPPEILANIERYSKNFERRIFTRFVNPPKSIFRRKLGRDACAPGSPDVRLLIKPEPGELVFDKKGYGLSPAQVRRLKAEGVSKVIVCGMDTDACVLGVMYSLFDRGIDCRLAPRQYCYSSQQLDEEARKIMKEQFPVLNSKR
ncbi:MAG TPA: isochorismatase family protein [Opitutaceae bacterium]|nr:isochorismatase family protein [Opitutaceae bacterium]